MPVEGRIPRAPPPAPAADPVALRRTCPPFLAPDTPYDTGTYLTLLCRAVETLLWHHGYDGRRLLHILAEQGIIPE